MAGMTGMMGNIQGIRTHYWLVTLGTIVAMLMSAAAVAEPVKVVAVDGVLEFRHDESQAWRPVSEDSELPIPVEFRSGVNSSARVFQSGTSFDISADSRVTLTNEDDDPDGLVSRVKQWFGTVFYDVERQPDTFSVETAFLVATVKGTQFTIVATEASSFVTLKEGRLEVVDLEGGDIRILEPGDIASVKNDQAGIDSLQQTPDALSAPEQRLALDLASDGNALVPELAFVDGLSSSGAADLGNDFGADVGDELAMGADVTEELDVGPAVDVALGNDLDLGLGNDLDVGLGNDLDVALGNDLEVDLGNDLEVDLGNDLEVDLGNDLDVALGNDLDIDLGNDLNVGLGNDLDVGLGNDLDVGLGNDLDVGLGNDLEVDLGDDLDVDLGNDLEVDLGDDLDVALGNDLEVDLGDGLDVDLGADLDVDLGDNLNVDLDLDLGLGLPF